MTLTLITLDWVPEFPRGFVRDLRVRWALEEIGRAYQVETVAMEPKSGAHRALQPFGQVPILRDGDLSLFESGAILLYVGEGSALLPEARRAEVIQWLFAALNTVEIASAIWLYKVLAERWPEFFGPPTGEESKTFAWQALKTKLSELQAVMQGHDWIAGDFSLADIAMVDTLRVLAGEGVLNDMPVLSAYVARAEARPAFVRAMADHMAHWQAADATMTRTA
ncbi:glutathione S-transferase [Roseovarius sp. MBR-51]